MVFARPRRSCLPPSSLALPNSLALILAVICPPLHTITFALWMTASLVARLPHLTRPRRHLCLVDDGNPRRTPSPCRLLTLHAVTFALRTMASLVARPPQLIHPCPHPDTRTAVTVTVARPLYLARRHNHAPFPSRLLSSPHMPSLLRTLHTWTHLHSQADSKVTHLL
jgi:hypothetical protein